MTDPRSAVDAEDESRGDGLDPRVREHTAGERQAGIPFIGAGPGDPGLLTLRGKELVDDADLVVHAGSLVSSELLEEHCAHAELVNSVGKDLEELVPLMRDAHEDGRSVARLHSGDPAVYGAALEQIDALERAGVPAYIVPGVTSAFASAATLRTQLTLNGVADHVAFTRPQGKTLDPGDDHVAEFVAMGDVTTCIYLGTHAVSETMDRLLADGVDPDTPAAVVYHASWSDEDVITGTVETVGAKVETAGYRASAMVLIGEAATGAGYDRSYLYGDWANREPDGETDDGGATETEADDGSATGDGSDGSGDHCSTADSDGETTEEIAVVSFERRLDTAAEIVDGLADRYESIDVIEYHGDVFADHWGEYDCFVGLMASGIAMRKTAPLLDDKWDDPAVVVVDEELTWAIPLTGGHHGANQVADDLASLGAVPAMTTASEAADRQGVERRAKALSSHVVNGDSTVATNLAVLDDELGPVERLDGPRAVLVDDDVTVLKRNRDDGVVVGTGSVSGADEADFLAAWDRALDEADREWDDVEFVATATRKAEAEGLLAAAAERDVGVVAFGKETLLDHEGPTPSKAKALIGWPGVAEASAIAGGRDHELIVEKLRHEDEVTAAVGR